MCGGTPRAVRHVRDVHSRHVSALGRTLCGVDSHSWSARRVAYRREARPNTLAGTWGRLANRGELAGIHRALAREALRRDLIVDIVRAALA